MEEALYRYLRSLDVLCRLEAEMEKRFLAVTFEELVAVPDEVVRRVSAWLKLDFHEAMIDGYTPLYKMEKIDAGKAEESEAAFDECFAASFPNHDSLYRKLCLKEALSRPRV